MYYFTLKGELKLYETEGYFDLNPELGRMIIKYTLYFPWNYNFK